MPARGTIEVNELFCKGCALCVPVCPPGVIALDTTRLTPKGYHPAALVAEGCTGCAVCAVICPDSAITVFRLITPRREKIVES